MTLPVATHRITAVEFHRMVAASVFAEDDRLELIDGELIAMTPIGRAHAAAVNRATRLFTAIPADRVVVQIQGPVQIDGHTEAYPDVALLRPRADFYAAETPQPADVFLLVEVADSSVAYDRDVKAPRYAGNGIQEYWLINLQQRVITVYRDPAPDGYETMQTHRPGRTIAPLAFPDFEIAVEDILGPTQPTAA